MGNDEAEHGVLFMKLFLGDCLEVMKQIPGGSVDLVLCDPPYGATACKWDTRIPFEPLWAQLHRVCKPNAAMCMFGSEPFSSLMRMSNLKRFKYDWIWDKVKPGNIFNSKRSPLTQHELISVFGGKNYYPIKIGNEKRISKIYSKSTTQNHPEYGDIREYTGKFPKTILTFSNANQNGRVHPTQKPVALLEYLIKTYTNEGDTVLDPTAGSFSTGVACVNLNRKFIGIEMDENYFKIGQKRVAAAQAAYDMADKDKQDSYG